MKLLKSFVFSRTYDILLYLKKTLIKTYFPFNCLESFNLAAFRSRLPTWGYVTRSEFGNGDSKHGNRFPLSWNCHRGFPCFRHRGIRPTQCDGISHLDPGGADLFQGIDLGWGHLSALAWLAGGDCKKRSDSPK